MQKIKDLIYYNRKEIITVLLCFIIFGSILFFNNKDDYNIKEYEDSIINKEDEDIKEKEIIIDKIVVDIKGEVNSPGTYELDTGNRINDAIIKAGGLTNKADTTYINLSEKLTDEMLIVIPSIEKNTIENNKESTNNVIINDNKEISKETTIKDSKISINSANLNELITIKGIGEAKAKSIIEYREKNGLFKKIEDITKVSGIGSSTFEKIKDYIKV